MINFLRRIRRNLITGNKVRTYLVYAIGEIVLVVIGIIIALQLNILNESRKQQNAEQQLYANILEDIVNEYQNIEFHQDRFMKYQDFNFRLYDESVGKKQYDGNEYYNYLQWIHRYKVFIADKYAEALSSITNDKIHDLLKLYITQENYTNDAVEEWNEQQRQRVRPFLSKHGINSSEAAFEDRYYDFTPLTQTDFINHSKLSEQYGSIEFDQLLFDRRFKTSYVFQNLVWQLELNREFQVILSNELASANFKDSYEPIDPKTIKELVLINKTSNEVIKIISNEVNKKPVYNFSEDEVNEYGYALLGEESLEDALTIFKLNTELYPDAWNTYDSYGECLLESGDVENGIKAYEKSLELNPDNSNAKEALSEIQANF